ncbi:MAG: hypothetical protein VX798_01490 [Bacteroidota bacterium]|nr:hypothetical protein [Bacteroidota bacterium]
MGNINYIKHLNGVFGQFVKDGRLNPTHISLYVALFQLWNNSFFRDTFYINREEVMGYSKIGSKSTYHRCIKELSHWGYIRYEPSHNPFKGSRIKLFDFGTSSGQEPYPSHTKIGTSTGQALVPIIKQLQTKKNNTNGLKPEDSKKSINNAFEKTDKQRSAVPIRDNLRTTKDKDYDQPL